MAVKSIATKMGIKANMRTILIHAPADAIKAIELPTLEIKEKLVGDFDYIHFFANNQAAMHERFSTLTEHLKPSGTLWLSWPKGGQHGTDLTIKSVIKIGYDYGLVESTCLSINSVWSAIKFTYPKKGKVYNNSYGKLPE
jgi:hypothetical protein